MDTNDHNPGNFGPFEPVLEHPVIKEMLQARERELQKIEENGGRYDIDGRWIKSSWFKDRSEETPERNALAYAAQSVEQFLMEPILIEAEKDEDKSRPNFQILLYQADGCTIQCKRERDSLIKGVVQRLQNRVAERSERNGILTQLELDHSVNADS